MLGDLGKLIVSKCFKKLPKAQKIARSGHTGALTCFEKLCSIGWKKHELMHQQRDRLSVTRFGESLPFWQNFNCH